MRRLLMIWLLLLPSLLAAQQSVVIVPNSVQSLNRSFLFFDEANDKLLLLYEKRSTSAAFLTLEKRRPDNLHLEKRYTIPLQPRELLRQAEYRDAVGIVALVQSFSAVNVLRIDPASGSRQRSLLYTLEEAKRLDRSIQRIQLAGLNWNDRSNKWQLLINLESPTRFISLLATFDSQGLRAGLPVRVDAGKGQHRDLAINDCRGDFAGATAQLVRLLKSGKSRPLETPEDIAFDPESCRYAVARRPFSQIPQFLILDPDLNIRSTYNLPGGVATGLIQDTRNQLQYWKGRKTWIYPTVADHQILYLNEITASGVRSKSVETPIDAGSLSIALSRDRIYLLISGLQFGLFERLHRLVLMKAPPPE